MKIKAAIIGATGYTGIELLRLTQQHPHVEVNHVYTESYVGENISDVYPHLRGITTLKGEKLDLNTIQAESDVVFISLPHGHAINIIEQLLAAGKKVIDLGADFRLKNPEHYQQWYKHPPASEKVLQQAVYGLAEISNNKELIQQAQLIANPGCYPTASLLATIPALTAGIIDPQDCIYDAKSGISGGGRSFTLANHFCEVTENVVPYQMAGLHRHIPEIEQELTRLNKKPTTIQFTPQIVPMIRGMLVTAYFKLTQDISQAEVQKIYQEYYRQQAFIRICPAGSVPHVKQVQRTNYCDLGLFVDTRTKRLIVVSVIDNLIKGASGQALQNMNLMYQLPETTGLNNQIANYP